MYPPIPLFVYFLTSAHHNTYANLNAPKVVSLRPDSKDYHFVDGEFEYHDTYFGGRMFIGEEIVYWKGKPVWGMNYYGFGLLEKMPESYFDAILRPSLMEEPWPALPVRGPEHFEREGFVYSMSSDGGTIERFSAEEQIRSGDSLIFRNFVHGGWIE